MTFSMPPFHQNEETAVTELGDLYMAYRGERITCKVISDEPYRHMCISVPAVPLPSGDHLVLDQMLKASDPARK